MIFTASCMLNCSPGPRPGAPLKSPIVSLTRPKLALVVQTRSLGNEELAFNAPQLLPTEPGPEARLIRLKTLNMSACSRTLTRSPTGMLLKTDRSKSPKPGARNRLRARSPIVPGAGAANAAGFHHCVPPFAAENEWEIPAYGLPIRSRPKRVSSDGCPVCQFITLLTCQSLTNHFDHPVAHEALGTS